MKCITCSKEFNAVRGTAKYCSDACKKRYQRQNVPLSEVRGTNDEKSVSPKPEESPKTRGLTDYYHSEEFQQIIHNLDTMSVKELKEKGIWIPAWKYSGIKRPFKTIWD